MSDQLSERIVYAGLRRMTDNRSLIRDAYSYWQKQLSNEEFDVIKVVSELVTYLDLSDQEKKTLMIALHAASNKLLDELPPVPGVIASNDDTSDLSDTSNDSVIAEKSTPHQKITQQYIQLFSQHIRKVNSDDFTDFRQEIASNGLSDIDPETGNVIIKWASDGMANLKLPNDITEESCKALSHQFYLLATEFIGPNESDDIVVKAINNCLDMEEAARFNPRDLV